MSPCGCNALYKYLWSLICVNIRLLSYDDNQILWLSVFNDCQHAAFHVVLSFPCFWWSHTTWLSEFKLAIDFHLGSQQNPKRDQMGECIDRPTGIQHLGFTRKPLISEFSNSVSLPQLKSFRLRWFQSALSSDFSSLRCL